MKVSKTQLRSIIKEEKAKLAEVGFHSMSPAGKALANSVKGKFMRMYPDAKVGIDGRGGFITVNGKKAIDMSQATGRGRSDEEMIDKMHAVYAQTQVDSDVPTADTRMDTFREGKMKITKRQFRRIIKEELSRSDRLGATEPRHTVNRTATEKLVSALMQRAAIDGMPAKEAAVKLGLGSDPDVVEYIQSLLDNQLLDNPIPPGVY